MQGVIPEKMKQTYKNSAVSTPHVSVAVLMVFKRFPILFQSHPIVGVLHWSVK